MGKLRALASVAVLALASVTAVAALTACGDDSNAAVDAAIIFDTPNPDAPPIDAPPVDAPPNYDLSCLNNTAPTTATATIALSGVVQEAVLIGQTPSVRNAQGVTVDACRGDCTGADDLGTTGPTGTDGAFATAAIDTGSAPLEAYLIATKTGNRTTYVYPAAPLVADQAGVPALMLSETLIPLLSLAGINQTAGNSMFAVLVTDCSTPPVGITGATVSVTQKGVAVGDAPVDASAFAAEGAGAFLVANVPPGDTTVHATYNGMTFRAHVVGAFADTVTTTQIKPGF